MNRRKNPIRRSTGLALVAIATLTAPLPAVVVTFDSYVSPTDNDLANGFQVQAIGNFAQVTSGGITGGAVASEAGRGGYATYLTSQTRPSTLSISFFYSGPGVTPGFPGGGTTARLGWLENSSPLGTLSPATYFFGEFYTDGGFQVQNNNTGQPGQAAVIGLGSIAAPTLGHWMQLTFSAIPVGPGNYQLTLSLADLGASGLDAPTPLFSGSTEVANALAAADTSMYPGFYGYYRAPFYDNFTVQPVPEAATTLLAGLGAALAGGGRRRRR